VGMYVCGPTVYSDVHLGNCRTFTAFDIVYRYLIHLGYKVRYVRNITDAGHLAGDVDVGGEDKMAKTAKALKLEPMEVAQKYAVGFHKVMDILNNLPPSIEPRATGHITEQIKMVQDILDNGYGYEVNGSVYFNTVKFAQENDIYGKLSGKVIDDLMSESRDDLKNQNEKQHPSDFAIWIKAEPTTLQVWDSPWGVGLPGWHLECSAMSTKYLGSKFDIHGGGEDLKFPHHENEIAQNCGACGTIPVQYWMHGNMLLMNGKKMSKSVGNSINPDELFTGNNKIFSKAYSPMVVRFSILQTHYRSTMDLTDEGMLAAEKGYNRLMEGYRSLLGLSYDVKENITDEDKETKDLMQKAFDDMNDDFATPRALASLFGLVNKINSFKEGHIALSSISKDTFEKMKQVMHSFIFDIFGLLDDTQGGDGQGDVAEGLMDFILELRQNARTNKDWGTSDKIRDTLKELNITVKDGKEGSTWKIG
ncbi:MAG: cysteine--tRNA ligase, partial [Saprospiraceae bacterium]